MGSKCLKNQWNRKVYQFHESVSWMKLKYEYTIYTFFHIYMVLCNSILDMNMSNFYSLCLLYFHKSKIQFSNNTGNLTKVMKRIHLQIFDHLWVKCHWNGNVFILMKFSSLAALKVVKMTTSSAASDENFVKMTTFSFQCVAMAMTKNSPYEWPVMWKTFPFHNSIMYMIYQGW